jgi:methylmalonyl-CoA mutase
MWLEPIEAAAAAWRNTIFTYQYLDEAIALPTIFARIARNTQLYLQEETKITKTRSWAGSYYVESLTNEITENAWKLLKK